MNEEFNPIGGDHVYTLPIDLASIVLIYFAAL
jgi:hypothetical protein